MLRRLLAILCLIVLALVLPLFATAQDVNHAGVVVQYGDGRVASRCVAFAEDSISGLDLIERAGFNTIAQSYGGSAALVCKIDDVGCNYPNEPCTCQCQGADCSYWSYFHLIDDVWHYSAVGAGSYRVTNGAVDGWAWGAGAAGRGSSPPVIPFAKVCPVAAAPPASATAVPASATAVPARPTRQPPPSTATARPSATLLAQLGATETRGPATDTAIASTSAPRSATSSPASMVSTAAARPAGTTAAPRSAATFPPTISAPSAAAQTTPGRSSSEGDGASGYLVFATIALVLAGAAAVLARRRAG